MAEIVPRSYRAYCGLLAGLAVLALAIALLADGVEAGPTLAAVLAAGALTTLPWAVQSGERSAVSINQMPILAAVFLCSPAVAIALAAALAAIDNRAYGRWVIASNAGALGLSAAAAAGVYATVEAMGASTSPGDPGWFFAAAAAAVAFFLANHLLVSGMIALKYREPAPRVWRRCLRPMVGADLIGSTIIIGFVSLVGGVEQVELKLVAACVAVLSVGLLLGLIVRSRQVIEAASAREEAVAEREEAVAAREIAVAAAARALEMAETAARAERRAAARARRAVTRLNDVAGGTVPVLVAMVDLRDSYTARHSANVGRLCQLLASGLGWSPEDVALAHMTGLVHDIGKVGLPDAVLRKPGAPTEGEWALIRRHADWGADTLAQMRLMPAAVDGVRAHHERWDGSGYPLGLRGNEIPSLGRLVAICDSYDAMAGDRPFREAMPRQAVREELARQSGVLYDPLMTRVFLDVLDELGELEELLAPQDFSDEWRKACLGIDMERLCVRVSADLEPVAPGGSVRA